MDVYWGLGKAVRKNNATGPMAANELAVTNFRRGCRGIPKGHADGTSSSAPRTAR